MKKEDLIAFEKRVKQLYEEGKISKEKLLESFQGWQAYAKWANSFKLRKMLLGVFIIPSTDVNLKAQLIKTY